MIRSVVIRLCEIELRDIRLCNSNVSRETIYWEFSKKIGKCLVIILLGLLRLSVLLCIVYSGKVF